MPIVLVDDGLDMPSSIYDSIKAITHGSVVFFWVKTASTHYQGAVFVEKMVLCLNVYPQAIYIKWLFAPRYENKQSIWKWLGHIRHLGQVYWLH